MRLGKATPESHAARAQSDLYGVSPADGVIGAPVFGQVEALGLGG